MPAFSDASEAPTMGTEDLFERSNAFAEQTSNRCVDDNVVYLVTADNKTINIKRHILAVHSAVLRRTCDAVGMRTTIRVLGDEKHWKIILDVLLEEDYNAILFLEEIKECMSLATRYRMKVVESILLQRAM